MVTACVICKNRDRKVRRFRFPNPKHLYLKPIFNKWVEFINREFKNWTWASLYKNKCVCAHHFKESDIIKDFSTVLLRNDAFPIYKDYEEKTVAERCKSIVMPALHSTISPNSPADVPSSADVPSVSSITTTASTLTFARENKICDLKRELQVLKKRHTQLKCVTNKERLRQRKYKKQISKAERMLDNEAFVDATDNVSGCRKLFLNMFCRRSKSGKGRKFTLHEKILALSLYKRGPKAYRYLTDYCGLPSRTTLLRLLSDIKLKSGFQEGIFNYLRTVANNIHPLDLNCSLVFDEIFLKPGLKFNVGDGKIYGFEDSEVIKIADHALVFMLKGLKRNWKIPLTFFFVESGVKRAELVNMITYIVGKVHNCGFKIRATISDQGSSNVSAINDLMLRTKETSVNKNINFYEIDGNKIYHFFDVRHLLKGVRNNFINADLEFDFGTVKGIAKWEDLENAYHFNRDNMDGFSGIPKIYNYHIEKNKIKKMKVKYAAQVFSHSMAAWLKILSLNGAFIDPNGSKTAEVINFFNDLFDSVNGNNKYCGRRRLLSGAVSNTSSHVSFWKDAIVKIRKMAFVNKRSTPSLKNWVFTLKSFIHLWKDLKTDGFQYLLPRRLNQVALENFFTSIRTQGKFNINPTPWEFVNNYKSVLLNNLSSKHSLGANCEIDDSYGLITSIQDFISHFNYDQSQDIDERFEIIYDDSFINLSCGVVNIAHTNVLSYISGYFMKKLKKQFNCHSCIARLQTNIETPQANLIVMKEYYTVKRLQYPSDRLLEVVTACKSKILQVLPEICQHNVYSLVDSIKDIVKGCNLFCNEHMNAHMHYLSRAIINLFVYSWVNNINGILTGRLSNLPQDEVQILAQKKFRTLKSKKKAIVT